jgi:hypothetical protein
LPYLDIDGLNELYERFNLDEPWDSPYNLLLAEKMPDVYRYLGAAAKQANTTTFLAVTGETTAFPPHSYVVESDITDGLETTILAMEVSPSTIVWTKPEDVVFGELFPMPADLGAPYRGSRDVGSRHVLLANGDVTTISDEIDQGVWRALMTIQGGEPLERIAISAFEMRP